MIRRARRVLVIRKLSDPCFSNPAIRQSGDPAIRVLVHATQAPVKYGKLNENLKYLQRLIAGR